MKGINTLHFRKSAVGARMKGISTLYFRQFIVDPRMKGINTLQFHQSAIGARMKGINTLHFRKSAVGARMKGTNTPHPRKSSIGARAKCICAPNATVGKPRSASHFSPVTSPSFIPQPSPGHLHCAESKPDSAAVSHGVYSSIFACRYYAKEGHDRQGSGPPDTLL